MEIAFYLAAALALIGIILCVWGFLTAAEWRRREAAARTQAGFFEKNFLQEQSQSLRLQGELREVSGELSAAREREKAAVERIKAQADEVAEVRAQLQKDFELLANRIFSQTQEKLSNTNKTNLSGVLDPLREQLGNFTKRVDDINKENDTARAQFGEQIRQLTELNQAMNAEAASLTRALKGDNKAAGNWGEMVLKNLLDSCGLEEGREYCTQVSARDENGKLYMPDVVVRLPEGKCFIIDSKVSLLNYSEYVAMPDEAAGAAHLNAFIRSVKIHIDSLGKKDYPSLADFSENPEYVLMFIPIEHAFHTLVKADPEIYEHAFRKHIVLVTPSTLLAALKTTQFIWRTEKQNINTLEIARVGGRVHDEIINFLDFFENVGQAINKARGVFDEARGKLYGANRNTLRKAADDLAKLGVKTTKRMNMSKSSRGATASDALLEDGETENGE